MRSLFVSVLRWIMTNDNIVIDRLVARKNAREGNLLGAARDFRPRTRPSFFSRFLSFQFWRSKKKEGTASSLTSHYEKMGLIISLSPFLKKPIGSLTG